MAISHLAGNPSIRGIAIFPIMDPNTVSGGSEPLGDGKSGKGGTAVGGKSGKGGKTKTLVDGKGGKPSDGIAKGESPKGKCGKDMLALYKGKMKGKWMKGKGKGVKGVVRHLRRGLVEILLPRIKTALLFLSLCCITTTLWPIQKSSQHCSCVFFHQQSPTALGHARIVRL